MRRFRRAARIVRRGVIQFCRTRLSSVCRSLSERCRDTAPCVAGGVDVSPCPVVSPCRRGVVSWCQSPSNEFRCSAMSVYGVLQGLFVGAGSLREGGGLRSNLRPGAAACSNRSQGATALLRHNVLLSHPRPNFLFAQVKNQSSKHRLNHNLPQQ